MAVETKLLPSETDKLLPKIEVQKFQGDPLFDLSKLPDVLIACIFGTTGAGKTHLLGTISEVPEMCPVLYINTGGGPRTLKMAFLDAPFTIWTPTGTAPQKWIKIEEMFEKLKLDK